MSLYEERVKRLHDHVIKNQKKAEKANEPTIAEIKKMLDEKGVEYDKRANKTELLKLLEELNKADEDEKGDAE